MDTINFSYASDFELEEALKEARMIVGLCQMALFAGNTRADNERRIKERLWANERCIEEINKELDKRAKAWRTKPVG